MDISVDNERWKKDIPGTGAVGKGTLALRI
jgi:hypothetical protein